MSDNSLLLKLKAQWSNFMLEVDQDLQLDAITAVFGPSAAGKTSLLRLIAGFEQPNTGNIRWRSETWCDTADNINIPPHKRDVGMLFQDGRLFSHLSVLGNLQYAATRSRHVSKVDDIVELLALSDLLSRSVSELSGGERQRVALGRTLLTQPSLMLFDEPLSALDRQRKQELLAHIRDLHQQLGISMLYVSHDLDEVNYIADQVLLLEQGRCSGLGETAEILNRYSWVHQHDTADAGAVLSGKVARVDEPLQLTWINIDGTHIALPYTQAAPIGQAVRLRIRASDVALSLHAPEALSIRNALPATITQISADPASAFAYVRLSLTKGELHARITRAAANDLQLVAGMSVFALIKSASFFH